nr:hypothetical protein [Streptococcus equi]
MRNWKITEIPTFEQHRSSRKHSTLLSQQRMAHHISQPSKQTYLNNDTEIIKATLEEFKKSEYVEIAMGEAVQKVDDLEKLSQETAKTATTAQAAAGLAKVSAERTQKMINLQTIHMLTSVDKIEPDIYKGMLELIEPAKKGQYQEHDVFTVLDDKHEDLAGEGNLVFVYVNEAFTYDKQTLKDLESEDKVTVIKYADLVKGK